MKLIQDMPHLRKKLEKIDRNRLTRLREAKANKDIKRMVENLAESELKPKILTDQQRMAIYYMTDFVHNYKYSWICTKLNVDVQMLAKWRNEPLFLRELDKEITRRRNFMRLHAFRNVFREVSRGNIKVSLQYLQMTGDMKNNLDVNINDNTGEKELDDNQLNAQIDELNKQLAKAHVPSGN